ncbi:MAG: MBL fold metallo-hydrolase, partial [Planctomycetota bacterium]
LFTHNHVDHIFGLDEVRRFNYAMGSVPIDIYAEGYTLDALRRVYKHVFDAQDNVNKSFVATLIPHELREGAPVDLHGVRFTPIRLLHGRLPIFGFRIEPIAGGAESPLPLAYCTDTSAIPTRTWAELEGLDTLVLDGLRHRNHPTHFTVDQATDAALQIGARETYLTHIAHEVSHAEVDARLPEGVRLSYDGLALGAPLPERLA